MGSETHGAHSRYTGFTEQPQEIQSRGMTESSQAHELHGCDGQDILQVTEHTHLLKAPPRAAH